MYICKNDLIKRLVEITGKDRKEFIECTVEYLYKLYESYNVDDSRAYLNVPYKEKDIVKLLGARYDGEKKKWYVPQSIDLKLFSKWLEEKE